MCLENLIRDSPNARSKPPAPRVGKGRPALPIATSPPRPPPPLAKRPADPVFFQRNMGRQTLKNGGYLGRCL